MRYFRFFSRWWKYSRVEGFKTMAERKRRAGAHEKSAQANDDPIRRAQVGGTFAAAIQDQQLMADQHGFGNHTPETARLCQPNQSDDRMN